MPFVAARWRVRTQTLSNADHTLVMGVLNVTPDSFSDGGSFRDAGVAVTAGLELWRQGADIVDVGGESTRPGAASVDLDEELGRVLPVVAGLVAEGVVVSIDTSKPAVAQAAVGSGAEIINDITGLRGAEMRRIAAECAAGVVLVHLRGTPQNMQDDPRYDDVVSDVLGEVEEGVARAIGDGVERDRICIDPGIGFGKTFDHNLELLGSLDRFVATAMPVLVGASRKGFLGWILDQAGHPAPAAGRDAATAATTAFAIAAGATVVRVHDVASTLQVARVADAIVRGGTTPPTG